MADDLSAAPLEVVPLATLRAHPRNYRRHPQAQLEHLAQSLREHGQYRNVVIARDGTILAGHGVVEALRLLGAELVEVRRLELGPFDVRARKLLVADNLLPHLGEVDDRALADLLREVSTEDPAGLLGTGLDAETLANLVFVTRTREEVPDRSAAAGWAGLDPATHAEVRGEWVTVRFRRREDRLALDRLLGLAPGVKRLHWSAPGGNGTG